MQIRLTFLYGAIWTVALSALLFLITNDLNRTYTRAMLDADWNAMKGFLKIERGKAWWYVDTDDPQESSTAARLRRSMILIDERGNVLERGPSANYVETARHLRKADLTRTYFPIDHEHRMVTAGLLNDESHQHQYYAFLATPTARDRLWPYLVAVALSFLLSALMVRHCRGISTQR
jgi:hypothetical protein